MALQTITNISVDFYDKKYILINAKQYDKNSRFLSVTCYNHGELVNINSDEHVAYIRFKKSDGNAVFNFCNINENGKILVELTEQMLVVEGIGCADLVIVNRGYANVNTETGEITVTENGSILSTMTFFIDVSETSVENSEIESTYEFNLLNDKLVDYWVNFEEIVEASRYYYESTKNLVVGLDGGFVPMGTISFSELSTARKEVGYVYHISNNFVTDNSFAEGSGHSYAAGTNVYYTASGKWDCLVTTASSTALVDEVKQYLGI